MKKLILIIIAVSLSGCAGKWHKTGGTTTEFYRDKSQCNAMSYQAVPIPVSNKHNPMAGFTASMNRLAMLNDCMRGYGWSNK